MNESLRFLFTVIILIGSVNILLWSSGVYTPDKKPEYMSDIGHQKPVKHFRDLGYKLNKYENCIKPTHFRTGYLNASSQQTSNMCRDMYPINPVCRHMYPINPVYVDYNINSNKCTDCCDVNVFNSPP